MKQENTTSGIQTKSGTIRRINPLGLRVVVRIPKEQNITEGGLYLPEGAKEKMNESIVAEVIEVASALDDQTQEETNISGIPLGASILIPRNAGTRIPWDDSMRIVDTKEVLAIIDKIDIT